MILKDDRINISRVQIFINENRELEFIYGCKECLPWEEIGWLEIDEALDEERFISWNKYIEEKLLEYKPSSTFFQNKNEFDAKIKIKQHDRAIELYQKDLQINPKNYEAHYNIGIIYFHKKEYDKAIEAYKKSIEINPKYDEVYYNMGITYSHKKEYDNAIEAYKKAIEINSKNDDAYANIGSMYFFKKDYYLTEKFYQKALEVREKTFGKLHPSIATSYQDFSTLFYEIKDLEKAYDFMQKAIKLRSKIFPKNHPDLTNSIEVLKKIEDELVKKEKSNKVEYDITFECKKCSTSYAIDCNELDWESVDGHERGMGVETNYESFYEETCHVCDNDMNITFNCWEYPVGAENMRDVSSIGIVNLEGNCCLDLTSKEDEKFDNINNLNVMEEWFYGHYENPAESLPSSINSFSHIYGESKSLKEILFNKFEKKYSKKIIEKVIDKIENKHGFVEWVSISRGDMEEEDYFVDTYIEELGKSNYQTLTTDIDIMEEWFHQNYEDPAERLPYISKEGGYQTIHGELVSSEEALMERFEEEYSELSIKEAIDRIESKNGYMEWSPIPQSEEEFQDSLGNWAEKKSKEDEGFDSSGLHSTSKEYDKSFDSFYSAVGIDSKNANYFYDLGQTYTKIKSYDRAIEVYLKAIRIDPSNTIYYYNLGLVYSQILKLEKAIESYQKAVELDPKNDKAYFSMGNTYIKIAEYDKAIEAYEIALKIDPENDNYRASIKLILDKYL